MNKNVKPWLMLSFPLGLLVLIAAAAGAFAPDMYALDAPAYAVQGIGQDFATLFVAVPALLISTILALRGSTRALLVNLGVQVYLFYSYSMYAITVHFNVLFLVYCFSMGLAFFGLTGILASLDRKAVMNSVLRLPKEKLVRRLMAGLLFVSAAMFYFMWLSEIIPHLMAGTTPASIIETGLPSNMVHVYDLSILLPALILTGIWLLGKKEYGFVLAPILVVFELCMALALVSMVIFMYREGTTADISPAIIFAVLAGFNAVFAGIYLKAVK